MDFFSTTLHHKEEAKSFESKLCKFVPYFTSILLVMFAKETLAITVTHTWGYKF